MPSSGLQSSEAIQLLDWLIGGQDLSGGYYRKPPTWYVALFNVAYDGGNNPQEPTGTAYARVAVTNDATKWTFTSPNKMANAAAITFPTVGTGGWGAINGVGLYNAASGGILYFYGLLTTPQNANSGDQLTFPIGSLVIQED